MEEDFECAYHAGAGWCIYKAASHGDAAKAFCAYNDECDGKLTDQSVIVRKRLQPDTLKTFFVTTKIIYIAAEQ